MTAKVLFIPNSKHTEAATAACMTSNIVAFGRNALLLFTDRPIKFPD